jgi:hypothetical protein
MQARLTAGAAWPWGQGAAALRARTGLATAPGALWAGRTLAGHERVEHVRRQAGQGRSDHHFLQVFGTGLWRWTGVFVFFSVVVRRFVGVFWWFWRLWWRLLWRCLVFLGRRF